MKSPRSEGEEADCGGGGLLRHCWESSVGAGGSQLRTISVSGTLVGSECIAFIERKYVGIRKYHSAYSLCYMSTTDSGTYGRCFLLGQQCTMDFGEHEEGHQGAAEVLIGRRRSTARRRRYCARRRRDKQSLCLRARNEEGWGGFHTSRIQLYVIRNTAPIPCFHVRTFPQR